MSYYLTNMKNEQIKTLTNLADDLKIQAFLPQNTKSRKMLLFIADSATLLAMNDKHGSEKLIELVNPKGDKVVENALIKFLNTILEIL